MLNVAHVTIKILNLQSRNYHRHFILKIVTGSKTISCFANLMQERGSWWTQTSPVMCHLKTITLVLLGELEV